MRINSFITLFLFLFLFSCNTKKYNNHKSQPTDNSPSAFQDTLSDSLKPRDKVQFFIKDTTMTFSIEGLSAEGSEVKAHYIGDTIKDAKWEIYGETGQVVILYQFLKNGTIRVAEKRYDYKTNLGEVHSEKDMYLKSSLLYILDNNGEPIAKIKDKNFNNLFVYFKQKIPFIL